ncbi:MAG: phenylacetate--CoA ligase family protein, partial [Proteobacteria bacterium]|nr:phenylacetate--CoA ligase family protein [Pseudomonadota bacterium]
MKTLDWSIWLWGIIWLQRRYKDRGYKMFHKLLFILAHQIGDRYFYPTYKKVMQNQWQSYEELKEEQEKQLSVMIDFAYKNVPYYHKLLDDLKLSPDDIKKVEDLEKLPILTKDIIKQNWEDFKPVNLNKMRYYEAATGGSTGTPLKYRLYKFDRFLGGALLYRGWGYGGYALGDKMVFLAGTSLDVGTKPYIIKIMHEISRNLKKLSAFDMGERELQEYVNTINSFKPKFIRGYASSIYFFSKWIEENNLEIHQPLAVFTTAEKLYPNMREKIGDVFNCDVYDGYGLGDGGVTAWECPEHSG